MTREQALYYLVSTGLTEEQVMEVVEALKQQTCEDCISRQAVLDIFADNADVVRPYSKTWEEVKALPSMWSTKSAKRSKNMSTTKRKEAEHD